VAVGLLAPSVATAKARIWEQTQVIPTYAFPPADVTPRFYDGGLSQGAEKRVYPYRCGTSWAPRWWTRSTLVYMENDYVEISFLPQWGGKLFSARDKTNGYDYFYRQSVIKPGLIGPLGVWISGGIECNFPHHHRPTTHGSSPSSAREGCWTWPPPGASFTRD